MFAHQTNKFYWKNRSSWKKNWILKDTLCKKQGYIFSAVLSKGYDIRSRWVWFPYYPLVPSRVGNVTGYLTSLFMKYSDFTISRSRPEHHNVGCIGCRVSPHTGILERTDIASAKSQGPIDQASLSCNACISLIVYFGCRRVYVASHICAFLYLICFVL